MKVLNLHKGVQKDSRVAMTLEAKALAAIAIHRFGLAPRPGLIEAVASDPRAALIAELDRPDAGSIVDADLRSTGEAARAAFKYRKERKAAQRAKRQEQATAKAPAMQNGMQAMPGEEAMSRSSARRGRDANVLQQIYLDEARQRIDAALDAEIGFTERLVWFWSNHFCVSARKGRVRAIAGAFEREAIRPHVCGRFVDMLQAVESHPAMLIYLDNVRSIGPNSIAGRKRDRGLNENLAREILELHTLGVRSVYTQEDVTNFAKVITGWTMVPPRNRRRGGKFTFNPRRHEPGTQTVIGRDYPDTGVEQGRTVLADVARHPATARHIATKLARHFATDEPPPALVERLGKRFLDTDGDLKEVAKALVSADEAWSAPRTKLKRPGEWIIAALRSTGVTPRDVRPLVRAQNMLGEPLWRPPAPEGFSDDTAAWVDGLAQRLDIANVLARRFAKRIDPPEVLQAALGPLASNETQQAVARAESRRQALTLLFMAPEFQRR